MEAPGLFNAFCCWIGLKGRNFVFASCMSTQELVKSTLIKDKQLPISYGLYQSSTYSIAW